MFLFLCLCCHVLGLSWLARVRDIVSQAPRWQMEGLQNRGILDQTTVDSTADLHCTLPIISLVEGTFFPAHGASWLPAYTSRHDEGILACSCIPASAWMTLDHKHTPFADTAVQGNTTTHKKRAATSSKPKKNKKKEVGMDKSWYGFLGLQLWCCGARTL